MGLLAAGGGALTVAAGYHGARWGRRRARRLLQRLENAEALASAAEAAQADERIHELHERVCRLEAAAHLAETRTRTVQSVNEATSKVVNHLRDREAELQERILGLETTADRLNEALERCHGLPRRQEVFEERMTHAVDHSALRLAEARKTLMDQQQAIAEIKAFLTALTRPAPAFPTPIVPDGSPGPGVQPAARPAGFTDYAAEAAPRQAFAEAAPRQAAAAEALRRQAEAPFSGLGRRGL